jgi:Family of unknown function (DUF6499)
MSGGSTWRSQATAADYTTHDYADFAQEFLRRNAHYGQDHALSEQRVSARPDVAEEEQEGLARRWGLSFPLSPGSIAHSSPCILVASKAGNDYHCRRKRRGN